MRQLLPKTVVVTCPSCRGGAFDICAKKEDAVAAVQCSKCGENFLLLDSEDHWFDVIQEGYPRLSRCACKSATFGLSCNYSYRDDGEVRSIDVWSKCASCGKDKRLMNMDIDYGDTEQLVTRPLRPCKNPKLLYDLKSLTLYATRSDIARAVEFLKSRHDCKFICWLRQNGKWVKHDLGCEETKITILQDPNSYLRIYATPKAIEVPDAEVETLPQEDGFWKRHEVLRISSPTNMIWGETNSMLFYIAFSNEYVEDGIVVQKSPEFLAFTKSLMDWLGANFVSWRGALSFDNPDEHLRVFGDRFSKKQRGGDDKRR